jgi:2'-phosphotransferase
MEGGQQDMDGSTILRIANSQKNNSIISIPIRRISVKAKARARDAKYEDENEGEGGLSGRGRGERRKGRDRIDALGRLMTKILRHEAEKLKLNVRGDGYVPVNELLKLKIKAFTGLPLCSHNVADVKEAVKNDNKQRFSLLEENGQLLIRANQGHSIKVVDSEKLLKPILSANEVPVCVHGTYRKNLESIRRTGLKRMRRLHIHFATGLPHDGVISGMRSNCEIMIFLDVQKSLEDGMKLYLSDNNVLLTEGLNGIVPPSYFAKIETWPDRELIS